DAYGLYINADGVRVGGSVPAERNVISGNNGHGLIFDGWGLNGVGNSVSGNYVGVGLDGTTVVANGGLGVFAAASGLLIGGLNTGGASGVAGAGNLISGNGVVGVEIAAGVSGVSLRGNFIGTDKTGTLALKNHDQGVVVRGQQSTIGGSVAGYGNLISGNGLEGVLVTGIQNVVQGNYIGTTLTGNAKLPNGGTAGVYVQNGFENLIGVRDDNEGDALEGNLISGSGKYGVRLEGGGRTTLAGNRIGTNAAGTAALSNGLGGVLIVSGIENRIGTDADGMSDALERNLISGNGGPGISTSGSLVEKTIIAGNYIGTVASGSAVLANSGAGIDFADNARLSRIGGGQSAERNVISGNAGSGIRISGAGSVQNWIAGNLIGVDVAGAVSLANGEQGIALMGAVQNTIGTNGDGSSDATEGNLISGNTYHGILLSGGGSHVVAGNLVGTTLSGTAAISNCTAGMWIDSVGNRIGSDGNGVSDVVERNVVSGNTYYGVVLGGEQSSGNQLRGNYVGTTVSGTTALGNGGSGIVLGGNNNSVLGGTGVLRGVISGNAGAGVLIPGGVGNSVSGSIIGLAADGTTVMANGGSGVSIEGGALGAGVGVNGGNVISGHPGDGVTVSGAVDAQIRGNLIGTVASGLTAAANAGHGVLVTNDAAGVVIGSSTGVLSDRNLISGNSLSGVAFVSAGAGNRVQGNYIGTDISGSLAIGNASLAGAFGGGVYISEGGGSQVLVGVDYGAGRHAGSANLISGNAVAGILIRGTSASSGGHVVAGNLMGLKAGGGSVLGNAGPGVWILNSSNNSIGSNGDGVFDAQEANVISGNSRPGAASLVDYAAGVVVQDGTAGDGIAARGNVIAGNAIGSDSAGQKPLANQGHGVLILSGFETQVGLPSTGNLLRYNGGAGVRIDGAAENGTQSAASTVLRSNSFQGNSGLPVDVGAAGISLNSTADTTADFPIFESASIENGKMTLTGFA
ncbi:MAG: beta strand repeat-containing protein, partial [Planctomycetaceae bacterium]